MNNYKINGRRKQWPRLLAISLVVLAALAGGSIYAAQRVYKDNLKPVSSSEKRISVTIPLGSSLSEITKLLKDNGLIRSDWAFSQYVRNKNIQDSLKAGTYSLSPSQSVQEIADIITQGKIDTNVFRILPAERIEETRANLINSGYAEAEVDAALKPDLYRNHPALADMPSSVTSLEGYLYPETIHKTAETKPEEIVRLFLDEMHKRLTPEIRNGIVAQGLTVHDGIILAAIIENEVSNVNLEEKPQVAQVFLKRLKIGMKLESDATAAYGNILGQSPNQYDTYTVLGLTPTPISNVSDFSLKAVANPASTSWLYFVSGKDCVTRFSTTIEEHEAKIAQYGLSTQSSSCR